MCNATIRASLTSIEYLEMYYRCLFFRADTSEELLDIRAQSEDIFEHTQVNPFIPHVSFLYGSMPIFQKQPRAHTPPAVAAHHRR